MNRIIIVTTVIILFFFAGCEKDYRSKYIGEWDFVTEKCTRINNEIVKRDTIYYSGKISLENSENKLILQYTESDDIEINVGKNGEIYVPSCPCAGYLCSRGNFEEKNKMNLSFGWDGYQSFHINGTKKEGGKK